MTIYEEAIAVQDGCNLVGIINGMLEVTKKVRAEAIRKVQSDETLNTEKLTRSHPVVRLFAEKISDLTGGRGMVLDDYVFTFEFCKANQNNESIIWPPKECEDEEDQKV